MCNTLVSFALITLSLWFKHEVRAQVRNDTGPACDLVPDLVSTRSRHIHAGMCVKAKRQKTQPSYL